MFAAMQQPNKRQRKRLGKHLGRLCPGGDLEKLFGELVQEARAIVAAGPEQRRAEELQLVDRGRYRSGFRRDIDAIDTCRFKYLPPTEPLPWVEDRSRWEELPPKERSRRYRELKHVRLGDVGQRLDAQCGEVEQDLKSWRLSLTDAFEAAIFTHYDSDEFDLWVYYLLWHGQRFSWFAIWKFEYERVLKSGEIRNRVFPDRIYVDVTDGTEAAIRDELVPWLLDHFKEWRERNEAAAAGKIPFGFPIELPPPEKRGAPKRIARRHREAMPGWTWRSLAIAISQDPESKAALRRRYIKHHNRKGDSLATERLGKRFDNRMRYHLKQLRGRSR